MTLVRCPRYLAGPVVGLVSTCPGPVAAMIGEGRLPGVFGAAGIAAGVALQPALFKRRAVAAPVPERSHAPGL